MKSISETIAQLSPRRPSSRHPGSRLQPFTDFGSNPGNLKAWSYVPHDMSVGAPLVVVLHGCTQTAAGYDRGSGWSTLADRHGFALLYPEQQCGNNANLCFNWFVPQDIGSGGEALSIRQMILRFAMDHKIDSSRIFVTGLSAGGAMTSVMLATSPDLFSGGAVIAGLPFASASGLPEALSRMSGHGGPVGLELAARVRGASDHDGPWPSLSVWHGTADRTVSPANMEALVEQWRQLLELPVIPSRNERIGQHSRRVWNDKSGSTRIEAMAIDNMGHGTPLDTRAPDGCGAAGPYMLDVGLSSTQHIAGFWGITQTDPIVVIPKDSHLPSGTSQVPRPAMPATDLEMDSIPIRSSTATQSGVAKVIDDALRAAGLLR